MPGPGDEKRPLRGRPGRCPECDALRVVDQRFCVSCGARLTALPPAVAAQLAKLGGASEAGAAAAAAKAEGAKKGDAAKVGAAGLAAGAGLAAAGAAAAADGGGKDAGWPFFRSSYMPSPRAAAAAVIGMLGLGVLLGSATSQLAQSAGVTSIILEAEPAPPEAEEEVAPEVAAAPEPEEAGTSVVPESSPLPEEEALPEEELPPEEPKKEPELVPFEEETLPEVKHVFLIALGENGYEQTFGTKSNSEYLSKKLPAQGEVVSNYYGVATSQLANGIALISGQGPTPETLADCPNYTDVTPGTVSITGQVEGNGCVYPAEAKTLPQQLEEKKLTWKAYLQGSAAGAAAGKPVSCRHPALGGPDDSAAPVPGDAYVTWRNPFVYFHSIVDSPNCEKNVVDLTQLGTDLKTAKKTPTLSYIVPDACHAGGEVPCEEGAPTGALAIQPFLEEVVPAIQASPAYQEGGLIVITSLQAPQSGPAADPSACCVLPEYPNLEKPAALPTESEPGRWETGGGGKVGMLLISNFVEPGSVNEVEAEPFNHYSLLLMIEELFELERIGYASEVLLKPFADSVFNGAAEEALPEPSKRRGLARLLDRIGVSRPGSAPR